MNPYALLDVFSFDEAVQAITGIVQPKTLEQKNEVGLVAKALRGDIDSGKLKADVQQVRGVRKQRILDAHQRVGEPPVYRQIIEHPYTETIIRIARADLLAWCEARGIRSELLPLDSSQDNKPLHASEKNTLLAIIRAFAELHGIKSGRDAYFGDAEALLTVLGKAGIEAPCNGKTLAKHLLASFKAR